MGYLATDLARIPGAGHYEWYVFLLDDKWEDELRQELRANIDTLSDEVGSYVLVVRAKDPVSFYSQLFYEYALKEKGYDHADFPLPALLVTDTPPAELPEERSLDEDPKMMIFPLDDKHRRGEITALLRDLARVLQSRDAAEALEMVDRADVEKHWARVLSYFELKPNFCGFGVNLNSLIGDLMKTREAG